MEGCGDRGGGGEEGGGEMGMVDAGYVTGMWVLIKGEDDEDVAVDMPLDMIAVK